MTFKVKLTEDVIQDRKYVVGAGYTLCLNLGKYCEEEDQNMLTMFTGICCKNDKEGYIIFRVLESSIELCINSIKEEDYTKIKKFVENLLKMECSKGRLISPELVSSTPICKVGNRSRLNALAFAMALEDTPQTEINPLDPKLLDRMRAIKQAGEEVKNRKGR
jgi:hypothetical protein